MELGLFEREAMIEKLARQFYSLMGYANFPENVQLSDLTRINTHPQEKMCVTMALAAIYEFEDWLASQDKDED